MSAKKYPEKNEAQFSLSPPVKKIWNEISQVVFSKWKLPPEVANFVVKHVRLFPQLSPDIQLDFVLRHLLEK